MLERFKAFDGNSFPPHGLITACPTKLGGKTIQVDVEVVDAPIAYNLLWDVVRYMQ